MSIYRNIAGNLPTLWEDIELAQMYDAYFKASSIYARWRRKLTWLKAKLFVRRIMPLFKACTVVSEVERQILRKITPSSSRVEVIPNCVQVDNYLDSQGQPEADTIIFVGALSYSANYIAIEFFLREVFPKIRASVPDARLRITGSMEGIQFPIGANQPGVEFTGYVDNIKELVSNSWMSVAPLLAGGGTRLKILEAFALGTPVVATTKGAEGLDVEHGRHLLIADTVDEFCCQTVRLLKDYYLRQYLAQNARDLVLKRYNWDVVLPEFLSLVEGLV